ncbi:hypothetical protein PMAYCL1PPCAC_13953, partial [Pristionchus mayeri]
MELKEEPIDEPLSNGNKPFALDLIGDEIKEEEIMNDDLMKQKEELIDPPFSDIDQVDFIDELKDESFLNEDMSNDIGNINSLANDMIENGGANEIDEITADIMKDSSETIEVEKRRKSARNIVRSVKYTDAMEESDGEDEPSSKRKQSLDGESRSKRMKVYKEEKRNATEKNELKCPECEFRSRSVAQWWKHLIGKHSTTPSLAGCLLRCDCGFESYSFNHSYKCEISKFTIIRFGDGSIRRFTDPLGGGSSVCALR